jgi:hypothetical protein
MSFRATVLKVMIASPGDVADERRIVTEAIHRWNDANAHARQLVLLPIKWETHSTPQLGPVNTIGASGVASENRARRGVRRTGLVVPKSRRTTKYGPILAATRRDGANFPDFVVPRRSKTPGIRHSSLLELEKIGSRRRRPNSVNRP